MPTVSVIVPFYNRVQWAVEAVRSVLDQTYTDFEIILVDDGSSEDVGPLRAIEDERFRYVRQENMGSSAARNLGLDLATGRFVAFLDADDLFMPDKLEKQVALMDERPDVSISHTSYQLMDREGEYVEDVLQAGAFAGMVYPEILITCPIATPTVMIRTDALDESVRFEESLHPGADILFWAMLAKHSELFSIDEPLAKVRMHGSNIYTNLGAVAEGILGTIEYGILKDPDLPPIERRKLLSRAYFNLSMVHAEMLENQGFLRYALRSLTAWPPSYRRIHGPLISLTKGHLIPDALDSIKRRIRDSSRRPVLAATKLTASALGRFGYDDEAHDIFYKHGFHLLRKHYFLPIPDESDMTEEFWEQCSDLVGLDMNDAGALDLLKDVFPPYVDEFREVFPNIHKTDSKRFYLINGAFMAVDAHVYYAFVRHHRPRRIVEVGSGFSTIVAAAAAIRNAEEAGITAHLTAIEPFPTASLKEGFPGLTEVVEKKVQDVDLEVFTSLEAGDVLFIDSTHALRAGGDVQFLYCEVLPRLQPGVLVHVHDVSLPKPYPRVYFEQNHLYWNEQYVLQTFLAFNSRFEVIWSGNYMMLEYPEKVSDVFPEYHAMREAFPQSEPSSFWIRVRN